MYVDPPRSTDMAGPRSLEQPRKNMSVLISPVSFSSRRVKSRSRSPSGMSSGQACEPRDRSASSLRVLSVFANYSPYPRTLFQLWKRLQPQPLGG